MSRDVLTVGSTMRIPLLYRGEYSQWVEKFMNYLEEQTDGEAMINSIKNDDQPLPRVTQIDRLARSLLIQGLPNDIYSLIDSNKTAKDLWDALVRHMLGSEYGEQDRKAAVLYEYETFKATEGELLLDTYIRYLQVINDLRKCGYSKDNYVNDAMGSKKENVVVTSDPLALIAEKTKVSKTKEKVVVSSDSEGSEADDFSELKKITALLAKAFNRRKIYSKPTNNSLRTSSSSQKQIADQQVLYDKMSVQLVDLDKHVSDLKNTVLEKYFKISKLEECVRNKDLEIENCLERLNVCENKLHKMGQTNQTVHMIMPSKDNLYNGRKGIGFENLGYFEKAKDLRPTLYDEKVIGLGYTLMFLTHSNEALEIEKFKKSRENKIEFAYDYGNLNASYVNEKINFQDDYFQEITNPDFEKIDSPFQQTSSLKPYVPNVILEKIIIDLEDEVVSLLEKEKANLETIESLKSKVLEDLKIVVLFGKKGSSNTSNVGLSTVSVSNLNKNVKRYSRKDLLACNNSHLGKTSSAYMCNDDMNVSCDSRMNDLLDDNNFFIFDDESVKISPVSKMPFRKKPRDSINVHYKSNSNKSLPRTVHKWLPKLQPLAEPIA
nr:hypothetical protein [Tanacetum cinerariifolium]